MCGLSDIALICDRTERRYVAHLQWRDYLGVWWLEVGMNETEIS